MSKELAKTWHDAVRIFHVPKDKFLAKWWGRVGIGFWAAVSLAFLNQVLYRVIELIKLLR